MNESIEYENIGIPIYDKSTGEQKIVSPDDIKKAQRERNKRRGIERAALFLEGVERSGSDRGFFFKMYEQGVIEVASLPKPEIMCFSIIQKYLRTNSPYVYMTAKSMASLMSINFKTEYKPNHCSAYLKRLCEKGLIARIDKDVYFINPEICYKGNRIMIKKWLLHYNLFNRDTFKESKSAILCENIEEFKEMINYNRDIVIDHYNKYLSEKSKLKI